MKRPLRFLARYGYAAIRFLYLASAGMLSVAGRKRFYRVAAELGYRPVPARIPMVPLSDLLERAPAITIIHPAAEPGSVSLAELGAIAALIQTHAPDTLFEIGTLDGRTTANMAANASSGARIYTLDLPGSRPGTCYRGTEWEPRIEQLYGDSTSFDFSHYHGKIDFVFIDADHSYRNVLADSRSARRLLRDGAGVIVWHDYGSWDWEGTTVALNELYAQEPGFRQMRRVGETSLVYLVSARSSEVG